MRAVFLDRDGTLNAGIPKYERVDSVDKVEILPGTLEGLGALASLDFGIFLVTNQAGIAEGLITPAEFDVINNKVLELVAPSGINVLKTYVCPHGEGDNCECRKPNATMLLQAAEEFDIDLPNSWMLGDRETDVMTGVHAGTKTILVKTGKMEAESAEATYTAPNLLDAVNYINSHSS